MKEILKQIDKAEIACNRAEGECGVLAAMLMPYFKKDIREELFVFNQHGDGLVVVLLDNNYPVSDVVRCIKEGFTDLDPRSDYCPVVSI